MHAAFNVRRVSVVLLDCAVVLLTFVFAFLLRFDFSFPTGMLEVIGDTAVYALLVHPMTGYYFSLYRGLYRFSSFPDLVNILKSSLAGGILVAAAILFSRQGQFPRSVLILHPILAFLGVCCIRFSIRWIKGRPCFGNTWREGGKSLLLIGAGDLGESLLRQILKTAHSGYRVVGFIDDDPSKWDRQIHGYTVFGGRAVLARVVREHGIKEVIIAIASRRGEIVSSVVETLRGLEAKPDLKVAPGLDEMLRTPGERLAVRKVKPEDLLNRDVIRLDQARIAKIIGHKTVLVTGAGGTIGGELCHQVMRYHPGRILLLESHATSLFYMEQELRSSNPGAEVLSILGDIRDQALIDRVFRTHRPHVVLHAAAHKHVHQLESNVQEGIVNNILGTFHLASAADDCGTEVFLLVSTDKAVRPTSVMGATKRVSECIVTAFAGISKTRFVGVRFGNVLGSSGSVLPIFEKQIAEGGPITVTDPRATRYFMTVEEAVGLILQAAAMARGGEIFILKMGTPVRIMDMARNLLLLSGLEPGKDIDIKVTGLRQGEKLDEELVEEPGNVLISEHPDIMVLRPANPISDGFRSKMLEVEILSRGSDTTALLRKLQEIIPTFQPASAHFVPVSSYQEKLPASVVPQSVEVSIGLSLAEP